MPWKIIIIFCCFDNFIIKWNTLKVEENREIISQNKNPSQQLSQLVTNHEWMSSCRHENFISEIRDQFEPQNFLSFMICPLPDQAQI